MRARLIVSLALLGSAAPFAPSRAGAPANPVRSQAADHQQSLARHTLGFSCVDTTLGVTIVAFDPTDWAPCPGLFRDDVVVSVDGVAIKAARDVDALLPSLEPFQPIVVKVRRFRNRLAEVNVTVIPRSYIALSPRPVAVRAKAPHEPAPISDPARVLARQGG